MEREPLRETIRRELTERIVAGDLTAGHPIRLVDTADSMGVSVTPLRESLVQLETDGFVRSDPGRGYSVVEMSDDEVQEIYPLIWTLETFALRQSPPDPSQLARLDGLNEAFHGCTDPVGAQQFDREWHGTLLAGCRNETLLAFLDVLKRRAARYEVAFMREARRLASSSSAEQHAGIVAHLSVGDLDGAVALLEQNWRSGPEVLVPWLRSRATH